MQEKTTLKRERKQVFMQKMQFFLRELAKRPFSQVRNQLLLVLLLGFQQFLCKFARLRLHVFEMV